MMSTETHALAAKVLLMMDSLENSLSSAAEADTLERAMEKIAEAMACAGEIKRLAVTAASLVSPIG